MKLKWSSSFLKLFLCMFQRNMLLHQVPKEQAFAWPWWLFHQYLQKKEWIRMCAKPTLKVALCFDIWGRLGRLTQISSGLCCCLCLIPNKPLGGSKDSPFTLQSLTYEQNLVGKSGFHSLPRKNIYICKYWMDVFSMYTHNHISLFLHPPRHTHRLQFHPHRFGPLSAPCWRAPVWHTKGDMESQAIHPPPLMFSYHLPSTSAVTQLCSGWGHSTKRLWIVPWHPQEVPISPCALWQMSHLTVSGSEDSTSSCPWNLNGTQWECSYPRCCRPYHSVNTNLVVFLSQQKGWMH